VALLSSPLPLILTTITITTIFSAVVVVHYPPVMVASPPVAVSGGIHSNPLSISPTSTAES